MRTVTRNEAITNAVSTSIFTSADLERIGAMNDGQSLRFDLGLDDSDMTPQMLEDVEAIEMLTEIVDNSTNPAERSEAKDELSKTQNEYWTRVREVIAKTQASAAETLSKYRAGYVYSIRRDKRKGQPELALHVECIRLKDWKSSRDARIEQYKARKVQVRDGETGDVRPANPVN